MVILVDEELRMVDMKLTIKKNIDEIKHEPHQGMMDECQRIVAMVF
jgi:hypothetical protein